MKAAYIFIAIALSMLSVQSFAQNADNDMTGYEFSMDDYPVIYGTESSYSMINLLMGKLLGFRYEWSEGVFSDWYRNTNYIELKSDKYDRDELHDFINSHNCTTNSHISFINLMCDNADLTITDRPLSEDELRYAENKGLAFLQKPIAKDAIAFLVNSKNPVSGLSIDQLRKIYTGEITNWKEIGGNDEKIQPYIRNMYEGVQGIFKSSVMQEIPFGDFPELIVGADWKQPYYQLDDYVGTIGFSDFYYYSIIVDVPLTKPLDIDGVELNKENIMNGMYPYVIDIYATIREDIDHDSSAYRLFEFLTTEQGQDIIEEGRYIGLKNGSIVTETHSENKPVSIVYTNALGIKTDENSKGLIIKTDIYENGKLSGEKFINR